MNLFCKDQKSPSKLFLSNYDNIKWNIDNKKNESEENKKSVKFAKGNK